jgi:DNA-binding transcriptional MerR regulator
MELVTAPSRVDDRLDPDARLTIAAVSELLDVPIPTIRSWERRYGFPSPARTQGKHRRYSVAEADQLRMLRDEIARGHATREAVEVVRKSTTSAGPRHELLERFLRFAMKLDPAGLRETLSDAVDALGPEHAIRDVARQSVMAPAPFRPYPLVLACGPKDLHTIGLEAFGVILARRGWSLRTLGSLTPVDSLVAAVRAAEARGAVITSQRSVARRAAVDAIAAVEALPGVQAFYAGMAFAPAAGRKDVPGTWLGDDIVAAATVIEQALPLH